MSIIVCGTMIHKFRLLNNPESVLALSILKILEKNNNRGGLKGRKMASKQVVHKKNTDNPARCPVRPFKLYTSICPKDRPADVFYLQPLRKPKQDCWFYAKPLGHNPLNNIVREMCKAAGISGYKTNHSLRATTATQLHQAGVDEQLIMECTGHWSLKLWFEATKEPVVNRGSTIWHCKPHCYRHKETETECSTICSL